VLTQALAVTVPLLVVLVLRVPYLGLAVRLWLVALGAIVIGALAERAFAGWTMRDGAGLRLRWGWWRRPRPERIRALEELEHAVDFSLGTAFDVHYRLRPHLVRIATHRLAARGVSLDVPSRRAEELLGPDAWSLVRPDRADPEDRNARGIDLPSLRRVVERLHGI
jgi:hypothetical protein